MTGVATDAAFAVVLGGGLGAGVCLLLAVVPRWGAPSLSRRIAPYLRDVADARGLVTAADAVGGGGAARWTAVRDRLAASLGGAEDLSRCLRQAGWSTDAAGFRAQQLAWALAGLLAGGAAAVALALLGRGSAIVVLLPIVCAVTAALARRLVLRRAARSRIARVRDELPTVLEFLALCLSAGEGVLDSLRRVGAVGSGELTVELRAVVLAVGTGSGLGDALTRMAGSLRIPSLTRSVDHVVAALDRGTPLAGVLQAQAADAREDAKRGLIEQAGRKEILMLVPLVFLILPLSVLFAVFPGIFMLRLGIG